jgi:cell division protein FtsI (penicillin-binding protein 3)
LPDLDTSEVRDRLSSKKGFLLKRNHAAAAAGNPRLGVPGIGFLRENKRVFPPAPVAHLIGLVNMTTRARRDEKWLDSNGLPICIALALPPIVCNGRWNCRLTCAEHALRDELLKAKDKYKAKAASGPSPTSDRRDRGDMCRCPTSTPIIRARPTIPTASTG